MSSRAGSLPTRAHYTGARRFRGLGRRRPAEPVQSFVDHLPGTLRRSCPEAQALFLKAGAEAVQA
jgi:hypothetical protein